MMCDCGHFQVDVTVGYIHINVICALEITLTYLHAYYTS